MRNILGVALLFALPVLVAATDGTSSAGADLAPAPCGWCNCCDWYCWQVYTYTVAGTSGNIFEVTCGNGTCEMGCGIGEEDQVDADELALLADDIAGAEGDLLLSILTEHSDIAYVHAGRRSVQLLSCGTIAANVQLSDPQWSALAEQ